MATLTMTSRGQVTFRKELQEHLGIHPGDKIEVDKLPDGSVKISVAKPTGSIEGFIGILKGKSKKKLTIEEMNQVIADGWAGRL